MNSIKKTRLAYAVTIMLSVFLIILPKPASGLNVETGINITFKSALTAEMVHNPLKASDIVLFDFAEQLYKATNNLKLAGTPIDGFVIQNILFKAPDVSLSAPFTVDIRFGYRQAIDDSTTVLLTADSVSMGDLQAGTYTHSITSAFVDFSDAVETDVLTCDTCSRQFEAVYFVLELDFTPLSQGQNLVNQGMSSIDVSLTMTTKIDSHQTL